MRSLRGGSSAHRQTNVDEIIGDHAEADPSLHSIVGFVEAAIEAVAPLLDTFKLSELEHYPLHYVTHVMHTLEVIAHYHPNLSVQYVARTFYLRMVHGLHLSPEAPEEMMARLTEDRIASGAIVS